MNELSTKVKNKLNIFQRMHLALFKRQKFDIKRYAKAPKYIQDDDFISSHIIYYPENWTYEDLSLIPTEKLVDFIEHNGELMQVFPENEKMNFIVQNPNIIHSISQDSLIELLDYATITGNNSFIEILHGNEQTARNYLYHLKDIDKLSDVLPAILRYMDQNIIEQILANRIDLINNLTDEQQLSYAVKKPEAIQYINKDLQKEIISNLSKMDDEYQIETITRYPKTYQYGSDDVKTRIYDDVYDSKCVLAMINLLKKDINNSKFLNTQELLIGTYGRDKPIMNLFRNINLEDMDTIKKLFLNTGLMSAKGKLLPAESILHGIASEINAPLGIDAYTPEQINIMQSLNTNQIQEVIEVDSNYALPYLTGINGYKMSEEEVKTSKTRCKQLFINMFGEEKLSQLDTYIDSIYNMQLAQQRKQRNLENDTSSRENDYSSNVMDELKQFDNIPLDHFKILFNKEIMTSNSIEEIKKYFDKLNKGEDTTQEFLDLMQNTYGEYARQILESRPGLNVHTINSLEIFDKRITENFELGFVHDLLSYNIRDFSAFLDVIKDPQRLQNFKLYYDVLSNIMGKNVETMQKAISEYMFNENLLNNIKDIDLTDEQYQNLISVMLSEKNRYNIRDINDLSNYNEIVKLDFKDKLLKINNETTSRMARTEKLKQCICENFLNIDYFSTNYGDNIKYLTSLFDMQDEISRAEMYSEEEIAILNVMNFLDKEEDFEKLMEFANSILSQEKIKNPISLYSVINKMKDHQIEIFNQSLLTIEKMEQLCLEQEKSENPLITKGTIGGVPLYRLQGVPFNILLHDTYGLSLEDYITYDGQLGNNAICSRNISEKTVSADGLGHYGYTSIEKDGGIIANAGHDANTNHLPKLVRGTGKIDTKINEKHKKGENETAFYRRYRNHDNITNENHGGKRLPDVYVVYSEPRTARYLKDVVEKGIPIVYIDVEAYKKINQQTKTEEQIER